MANPYGIKAPCVQSIYAMPHPYIEGDNCMKKGQRERFPTFTAAPSFEKTCKTHLSVLCCIQPSIRPLICSTL